MSVNPDTGAFILTVVSDSSVTPGRFNISLTDGIRGVKQIDLIEWAITGVPLTGGVPTNSYLALKMGKLAINEVEANGQPSGFKINHIAQADRAIYNDFTLVSTQTPMTVDKSDRWELVKPSGAAATASDYGVLTMKFRVHVDLTHH